MANDSIIAGFDNEKNDSLTIEIAEIEKVPRGLKVSLYGFVDTYNTHFLQNQVTKIMKAGFVNLIFDCEALTYISSTGVGILSSFLSNVKNKGGNIIFLKVQDNILDIFQLLGFAKIFTIADTLEKALVYLTGIGEEAQEKKSVFPLVFNCPSCEKRLRGSRAGRFRCMYCKVVIKIDETGIVTLD